MAIDVNKLTVQVNYSKLTSLYEYKLSYSTVDGRVLSAYWSETN